MTNFVSIALRDLRRGHKGFWVFFGCLALGVAAITTVSVLSSSILSGIERDGRTILGGDVSVQQQFRPLSPTHQETLRQHATEIVEFVELNTLARSDNAENSILVSLKAVDEAYPLYGSLVFSDVTNVFDALAKSQGVWGAAVDPSIVESGRAEIGDSIHLGRVEFRVVAVIDDEPARVSGDQRFAFWPRVIVHRDSLQQSGLLDQGSRTNYEYRLRLPSETDATVVREALQDEFSQAEVRDYRNASPNLSELVKRIAVLLTLAGLATLLVGGVGVSNAIRAYMDSRVSTIAILKCLGASSHFVYRTYLLQIVLLSTIGVLIGIAFGLAFALLGSAAVGRLLSVSVEFSFGLSLLLVVVVYGMLTAMLFALWPLSSALNTLPASLFRNAASPERHLPSWKVVVTTLVIAIALSAIVILTAYEKSFAIWFVIGVSVAWLAFRSISLLIMKLAKLAGTRYSPTLRLAIANLYRPGAATPDIVLSIGLGLSVLVATAMVSANLDRQIGGLIPEQAPDFFFIGIQSDQLDEFQQLIWQSTSGQGELDVLPYVPGRIVKIKGLNPYDALVNEDSEWLIDDGGERVFTYTSSAREDGDLVAGEWWSSDYKGPPLLSIHSDVASGFDVGVGDSITMNILGREIVGKVHNIRNLDWQSMQLNFAIMLSPEPLRSVPHSSIATANVPEQSEFTVQNRVAESLPNVTVIRVKDALNRVGSLIVRGRNAARAISSVTIVAGVLVLAGIIVSENRRRAYESVLLKTIGASRRYVLGVFSLEYLLQGTAAAVAATLLGSAASWGVVSALMGWKWYFLPVSAINTVILGLALSLTLGMIGILRALRHRPLMYLRNE